MITESRARFEFCSEPFAYLINKTNRHLSVQEGVPWPLVPGHFRGGGGVLLPSPITGHYQSPAPGPASCDYTGGLFCSLLIIHVEKCLITRTNSPFILCRK